MTKTLREELMEFYPAVYFMQDERTAENHQRYIKRVDSEESAIKSHFKALLPEKKECQHTLEDPFVISCDECIAHNACIEEMEKRIDK